MLIFPHIRYCLSVWSGCGLVQRHRIQKVINHCAQVVAGVRRSAHVTPLLEELGWPNLEGMIAESDCAAMHYLVNCSYAPLCVSQRFKRRDDVSCRTTRATDRCNLDVPRVRTEQAKRFFSYRAVTRWNALPVTVRETKTARTCRKRYRELVSSV